MRAGIGIIFTRRMIGGKFEREEEEEEEEEELHEEKEGRKKERDGGKLI